ncbi:spfh band 7 phb domain protein [Lasius niger]|uniref:Spfh band 7 phb domain protein n=1 Tax=Lasius niger TaxID=67767 RepID=A0A0J7JZY5_LASNI|nr:spfh band 7 phb domain protein [Lasius niger]
MFDGYFIGLALVLVVIAGGRSCLVVTQNKTIKVLETFGKYSGLRHPGLSFKLPTPIQRVAHIVPMNVMEIKTMLDLKTSDNLFINYPITVQYQVSDPVAASYELENPREQILSYISNLVRSEVGRKTFLELYVLRNEIQEVVQETLGEQVHAFGFKIIAVLVNEPIPSDEVQRSYNSVTASERQKEAAKNIAEARRIELVAEAQAQKESKKLQGEGIAEQREAIARGFKEATEMTAKALGISNEMAVLMILQLNKFDTLRDAANGHGTVLITDGSTGSQMQEIAQILAASTAANALIQKNS